MQAPSGEDLERIRGAAEEAAWLVARGYDAEAVAAFVGKQRALSESDQRLLDCNTRLSANVKHHIAREMDPDDVRGRPLRIDAESLLCSIASARTGALMLESGAGWLCDPTWTRGARPWSDPLGQAVHDVCAALKSLRPKQLTWLSRGGWDAGLSEAVAAASKKHKLTASVETGDAKAALKGAGFVVSADPAVLDRCATWLNVQQLVLSGEPNVLRLGD